MTAKQIDLAKMAESELKTLTNSIAAELKRRRDAQPSYFDMCKIGEKPLAVSQVIEPTGVCPKCHNDTKPQRFEGKQFHYCFTCQKYYHPHEVGLAPADTGEQPAAR